jgi:protein-S-isoprenylcysteine O-methyltransferase Ste14
MKLHGTLTLLVAALTLVSFGAGMRWFKKANQATALKTFLILSALVCAVVQLTVLALAHPASRWWRGFGIGLYVLAHVIYWWSLWAHGGRRPAFALVNVKPTFLTQTGPYRLVRHPIYTAYLLVWLAGSIAAAQPWLLLTTVWMLCFHYHAARQEERSFAESALAADYAGYKRRTGMFFPSLAGLLGERR